ncbi:hypothetical protein DTO217A2_8525 [Paecilomyces variotii]|nr:hypothetical protein DTO217A2_8525 [Paecilomyces variotii]
MGVTISGRDSVAWTASRLSLSFLVVLFLFFNRVAAVDNVTNPISLFKSRPDLYPPILTLELSIQERLSPGYIFVTPYEADNPGPYIYDNQGNLVWSGWGSSGPGNAHGMHVCKYKGSDHLCFFQGNQQKGYCRGHGIIMDNRYRIVRSVQAGGGMSSSDMHEFKVINNGKTALMTIYQQRQWDMSAWNIRTGVGWIMESIFQEVDVETSEVIFEWRSLDHVDPTWSYTYPAATDTSGTGLEPHSPWDYFHINSIDKNEDGDYLISSRHTSCIYKISGKDGKVIWRLHGANPSFKSVNFDFSQQHDARWLEENSTHTVLSLYNNGYNGFNQTNDYSSGMIIAIDHVEKTATLIREYGPPGNQMISSSQGNTQVLPNKNVFQGWGNNPFVSEHSENGELLLWGYIAKEWTMNYRALKYQWDADPTDEPALWAYSKATPGNNQTSFYVSWNGATRVKTWKFYGSDLQEGPFQVLAMVDKNGFETSYAHPDYHRWCYVEALDAEGKVLRRSGTKYTFVPSPELSSYCADTACDNAAAFGYPGEEGAGAIIPPPISPLEAEPEGSVSPPSPEESGETVNGGDPGEAEEQVDSDWRQGSSSSSDDKEGQDSGEVLASLADSWVLLSLGVVVGLGVAFVFLRRFHRRHRLTRLRDGSEESLEEMERKARDGSDGRPWWHWRRWALPAEGPQRYYALSESGHHGHEP